MRNKTTWHYIWFKYNIYKPIRNWLCWYGYGYDLSEDEQIVRRRNFIMGLK